MVAAHGLSEIPALTDRAAEAGNRRVGCRIFDAFHCHRDAQRFRQRRHGAHDCRAFRIVGQCRNEAAVDLDDVERQGSKVSQ